MKVTRFPTAEAMLAAAGDYLVAREAEHNLPLGILGTLRDHPDVYPEPPYLAAVTDGAPIALLALRTPPHHLILSEPGVPGDRLEAALAVLADDVLATGPDLPGVNGPAPVAARFAARWSEATGQAPTRAIAERIYRLTRVIPARPAPGTWRRAEERDRTLLRDWLVAFDREALPNDPPQRDVDLVVGRWITGAGRAAYLWEVDGRPVSLVAAGSPTPHGIRIGPVYTPPTDRRRGYAGALTAAVSQHLLDGGRQFCFLFTDLANPTSNHVYQEIGYEAVSDVDVYRFGPPEASTPGPHHHAEAGS